MDNQLSSLQYSAESDPWIAAHIGQFRRYVSFAGDLQLSRLLVAFQNLAVSFIICMAGFSDSNIVASTSLILQLLTEGAQDSSQHMAASFLLLLLLMML